MPWDPVKLNNGRSMPTIAFGTWRLGNGDGTVHQIGQAISVGFSHVDTAQSYQNEAEAGRAIRESGLARGEIFVTTKYARRDGLDIRTSVKNSLHELGLTYVDLYLIHDVRHAIPDIPTAWKAMEDIQAEGLTKSIGVSNFGVQDLSILMASAKVKPAAHQIMLNPYVYSSQAPIMEYSAKHGIVIEGYSPLVPITALPGGPVDAPVNAIAARFGVSAADVLIAWAKAKGAVVVTTSSKRERLEGYIRAGDIELTTVDIAEIDAAGLEGAIPWPPKFTRGRRAVVVAAVCFASLVCGYFGFNFV